MATAIPPVVPSFDPLAVLEHVDEPVMVVDKGWRLQYVNAAAEKILGRRRADILGRPLADVFPEAMGTRIEATYRRSMSEQKRIAFEAFYAPRGVWVETRLIPSPDSLTIFLTDINARKVATDALRESEANLAEAQRMAHIGSWTWDIQRDAARWSDETFRIFGMTPLQLEHHKASFLDLVCPADRERVRQALVDVVAGTRAYRLDYRIRAGDGREKWIHADAELLRGADGQATVLRGTVQDLTELKRSEEALRESRAKLVAAFRVCPAAIAITRLSDGMTMEANDAIERVLGYSREELIGRTGTNAGMWVDPTERERLIALLRRDGTFSDTTVRLRTRANQVITVQLSAVRLEYGGEECVMSAFVDVTDRENAALALRESEQRYRSVFENSIAGIYRVSPAGALLEVNPSLAATFGFDSPEEMIKTVTDVGHQLYVDPRRRAELWEQLRKYGRAENLEIEARRKDGSIIWVLLNASVARNEAGEILYSEGYNIDITQRKQAEEALRRSEAEYRLIFQNSLIGILVGGPDHTIRRANAAFCQMLEYSEEELVGKMGFADLTHPDDLAATAEHVSRRSHAEDDHFMLEKRYITKSGRVVHAIVYSQGEYDLHGRMISSTTSVMDITQRKIAEESLVAHQAQLRHLAAELSLVQARERRELAAYLHDSVTQDLAMARLQLQMLKNPPFPPDAADLIGKSRELLERAIERSRSLTLQLSPPALYEIGLNAALAGLVEDMQKLHPIGIELVMSRKKLALDESHRVLLYRAVRELLFNVVKHARAAHATVTIVTAHGALTATVADDGVGFDPAGPRSRGGFGLFSVREQIEGLGGKLEIVSGKGKGTRVSIVIPYVPRRSEQQEARREDQDSAGR